MQSPYFNSVLSSEIIRNYLETEKNKKNAALPILNEARVFDDWNSIQELIRNNPNMLKVFASWQQQFRNDPEKIKINKKLAEAVLALDLDQFEIEET